MGNILKNRAVVIFLIPALLLAFGWFVVNMTGNIIKAGSGPTQVKLETNMGDIVIELYSDMPITTGNFVKLVEEGFYDGVIFHRIIPEFMIQGGDPAGTGAGGPGYNIEDEFVAGHSNVKGTISMANTGRPNSGGSQFFINLGDNSFLDFDRPPTSSKHPVFGEVIEGLEIVEKIGKVKTDGNDRPIEEVKIIKANVI